GLAVARAARGLGVELLGQPLLALVDDRLDLAVVGGGREQERVGDGQHVTDVVGDDVVRELVGGRLGGGGDELEGTVGCGHYKAFGRRTLRPPGSHGPAGPPDAFTRAAGPAATNRGRSPGPGRPTPWRPPRPRPW